MSGDMTDALMISAQGMRTQGTRIRVISENIANANTTGLTPGSDPYTRQTISFKNELDREMGFRMVKVEDIGVDRNTPFGLEYNPAHPAANEEGYVKTPNVKTMIEMMDIREAQRSYEANLGLIEQTRSMISRTIELLRA